MKNGEFIGFQPKRRALDLHQRLTRRLLLGLNFDNRYSWNVKWSSQCTIVQARAYLDSEPVKEAVLGNENPDYTYYDFRTPT